MRVFISWSGERSKTLAAALNSWLPKVLQAVEPFYSEEMERGIDWMAEIQSNLNESPFGLVIVTPENQTAPWLLFEAGALFKALPEGKQHVVPIGLGFARTGEIGSPLGKLNGMLANAEGFRKLLTTMNTYAEKQLSQTDLADVFDTWWPKLEAKIAAIGDPPEDAAKDAGSDSNVNTALDMVNEVLETVRDISRRMPPPQETSFLFGLPPTPLQAMAGSADPARRIRDAISRARRSDKQVDSLSPLEVRDEVTRLAELLVEPGTVLGRDDLDRLVALAVNNLRQRPSYDAQSADTYEEVRQNAHKYDELVRKAVSDVMGNQDGTIPGKVDVVWTLAGKLILTVTPLIDGNAGQITRLFDRSVEKIGLPHVDLEIVAGEQPI